MGGKLSLMRCQEASHPVALQHNNADENTFTLTDRERQLIDSTWKQLTGSTGHESDEELGVRVFMRIFEIDPAIREVFPHFVGLNDREAMRRNVMFRCHGRRFVRAVRSVVDNLDSLEVIAVPNLDLLGRKHRAIHGFQTDYLRTFEQAMEDVWSEELGRKFDKSACLVWRKIFKLITSRVLYGYEDKTTSASGPAVAAASLSTISATPTDINGSLACNSSLTS